MTVTKGRVPDAAKWRDLSEDDIAEPGNFEARYPGRCAGCNRPFPKGELCRYNDADEVIAIKCCGPEAKEAEEFIDGELAVEIAAVMPPGKRHPTCPRCFQIPSANGVCGC